LPTRLPTPNTPLGPKIIGVALKHLIKMGLNQAIPFTANVLVIHNGLNSGFKLLCIFMVKPRESSS
jgi:hypothetical protein